MTDHTPFLATIARDPADMGPRLVYADWLEERGDPRGEYIRLAIELAHKGPVTQDGYTWNDSSPLCDRTTCDVCPLRRRCAALLAEHRREWTMAGLPEEWTWCTGDFDTNCVHTMNTHGFGDHPRFPEGMGFQAEWRCGFPEILTLRFEEWQRHYETLRDAMPVREVRLTTRPEYVTMGAGEVPIVILKGGKAGFEVADFDLAMRYPDTLYPQILLLLESNFPGHDAARPIKFVLPQTETSEIALPSSP